MSFTTIRISERNKSRLAKLGTASDSMDTVVDAVLTFVEKNADLVEHVRLPDLCEWSSDAQSRYLGRRKAEG